MKEKVVNTCNCNPATAYDPQANSKDREKARELDAILEWSHDGIWIMDGKGVTLRVSKSWEEFAGIKREHLIGRSVYDIVKEGYYSDSAAIHVMQELKKYNLNKTYAPRTIELITSYSWPGNVRELENLTERLVVTSTSEEIGPEQLPAELKLETQPMGVITGGFVNLKEEREKLEKRLIKEALNRFGSTRKAAAALGVTQPTVARKAKRYGLRAGG